MRVEVNGDTIMLIGITIDDPVAASMLEAVDHDDRLELVASMIEIGARVFQRQQDGAQGELLRREVERMEQTFARAQADLVSLAGRDFAQGVRDVMVEVSQQLTRMQGQLEGVLAVAVKENELVAERERGTAKGRSFEESVADRITSIARNCGDLAERVGDVGGISGRSGDVTVSIEGATGASRGTIVFEAKTGRLSGPESMRELDRALNSRGADFAVLVVSGRDRLPTNTHELREYGGNKMICAIEDDDEIGLEIAYSLARARVLLREKASAGADVAGALKAIEQAAQKLDDVRRIKLKLTSIQGAAEETKGLVEDMTNVVRSILKRAQEALNESS